MSIWQVLGFIGIGTVLGSSIQVFFNSRMQNKKLIFEARVKAYQGFIGKVINHFMPESIETNWPEDETEINSQLSEIFLLGSHELVLILANYKNDFFKLLKMLKSDKDKVSEETRNKYNQFCHYAEKIHEQMRKDLFIK